MSLPKLVTIKDVARESGVSIGAVSKVLHGRGGNIRVSEGTAERIRDAAKRLNYRPNYHARSLRSGRSRSIGLVMNPVSNIDDRGLVHAHVLDGVITALAARGYSLNVSPELMPLESVDPLTDGRYDGLAWIDSEPMGDGFAKSPIPAVAIGGRCDAAPERGGCFLVDEAAGFALLLDHLKGFGHERIAYLDRVQTTPSPVADGRRAALAGEAERVGIEVRNLGAALPCDALDEWEREGRATTAYLAWNDRRASEFLYETQTRGLDLPGDLSLAACDGTPSMGWAWPRLTALHAPLEAMIEDAMEHLLALIENAGEPSVFRRYEPRLDPRGSTGAAPLPAARPIRGSVRRGAG